MKNIVFVVSLMLFASAAHAGRVGTSFTFPGTNIKVDYVVDTSKDILVEENGTLIIRALPLDPNQPVIEALPVKDSDLIKLDDNRIGIKTRIGNS